MRSAGVIVCSRCGAPGAAGRKFCGKCGNALAEPGATQPSVARDTRASGPPAAGTGLSSRWLIIPTLIFAFLSRQPLPIVLAAAIAVGLWKSKTWRIPPTAPPSIRTLQPVIPYAPALQIAVVFVLLGGSLVVTVLLVAAVAATVYFRKAVVATLEPWWQMQRSIPPGARKALAFGVPAVVGYCFGLRAGGREWTYTLISIACGTAVAFLLLFTPPDSMRRRGQA